MSRIRVPDVDRYRRGHAALGQVTPCRRDIGRSAVVGLVAALFVVLLAGPAAAHPGDSPSADNYSARLSSVSPALPDGVTVQIVEFGNRLRLTNSSDLTVTVPGYEAEPYLRIGPDGVARNDNSPATYLNQTRDGTTPLPERADAGAEPEWRAMTDETTYDWHDHRTHWMLDSLPPQVVSDPDGEQRIIEWTIPLLIGSQTYEVSGVLDWTPPPPGWVSYLLVVGFFVVGFVAGWWPVLSRRSTRGSSGRGSAARLLGVRPAVLSAWLLIPAAAGSIWHVLSTPLVQGPTSSVVYGLLVVVAPMVLALGLVGFALRAALRGRAASIYLQAMAGWLFVIEGVPDLDVLFRTNVAAAGSAWLTRIAVALLVGLGGGLAIGAIGLLRARRRRPSRAGGDLPAEAPAVVQ